MNETTPAPVATPASLSLPARIARAIYVTLLSLGLSTLLLITLVATAPLVRESIKPLVSDHQLVSLVAGVIILALVIGVPLVVLGGLVRKGKLRWPHLAVLGALTSLAFVYLVWDDPVVRRPLTMEELAPTLPGDQVTHDLVLRYGKGTPATAAYQPPNDPVVGRVGPKEGDKWAAHLREHRAGIEAGWAGLADVRAWWDELAQHPRLGDMTPARFDAMIMAFQPVRAYTQHASAIAGLKALDGHGDEAADMMIRLYDVARKLEPTSRTLVRSMIAKVIQRMAVETTVFILDHAEVSPAKRAALVQAFGAAAGGPAGARRLVLIEYGYFEFFLSTYLKDPKEMALLGEDALPRMLAGFSRILVNPRTTRNLVGDRYYRLATLAEERKLGEFEISTKEIENSTRRYQIKNLGGRLLADMAMPAFSKVVKSYWEIEDARLALLAKLKA